MSLQTKIKRLPSGCLWGGAGGDDERDVMKRVRNVKDPEDLPSNRVLRNIKTDVVGILVFPNRDAYIIATGKDASMYKAEEPVAIGTGKSCALGAMDAGASAEEAVRIACRRDHNSKEPVHTLALESK